MLVLIQLITVTFCFIFAVHQKGNKFGFTKCKNVEHFGRDLWLFRSVLHMLRSFCLWQVVVCCYRVLFCLSYILVFLDTIMLVCK